MAHIVALLSANSLPVCMSVHLCLLIYLNLPSCREQRQDLRERHEEVTGEGVRERFFTKGLVRCWNGLPRAVLRALSLTEFQKCLDNTLRHMA